MGIRGKPRNIKKMKLFKIHNNSMNYDKLAILQNHSMPIYAEVQFEIDPDDTAKQFYFNVSINNVKYFVLTQMFLRSYIFIIQGNLRISGHDT